MKKLVERDLQRQVQNMLGTLMGQDKVMVSVTTDIDFKKENREENLVTPVDEENMEGIAISAQRITDNILVQEAVPPPLEHLKLKQLLITSQLIMKVQQEMVITNVRKKRLIMM